MSIAYGGHGTPTVTSNVVNVDVPYPSPTLKGDLLILHVDHTAAITAPASGWTVIANQASATARNLVCIRVADGTETGSYTVTTLQGWGTGVMHRYTGVHTLTPQDCTASLKDNGTSNVNTVVIPQVTTVTNDAWLVACVGDQDASATWSSAQMTERFDSNQTNSGGRGIALYDELFATAGATGTRTVTHSVVQTHLLGQLLALRPVPVVTGTLTVDAVLFATRSGSFTANAVIKRTIGGGYSSLVVSDGAIEYVHLDETGGTTGSAVVGTGPAYSGSPGLGQPPLLGDGGHAIALDRTLNQHIDIDPMAAGGATGAAVEMFVSMDALTIGQNHMLWNWGDEAATGFHEIVYRQYNASTWLLYWSFWDGAAQTNVFLSFASHVLLGSHHLVVSHDYAAKTFTVTIDGAQSTKNLSAYGTPTSPATGLAARIGGYFGNELGNATATIDEVSVYTKPLALPTILIHLAEARSTISLNAEIVSSSARSGSLTANAVVLRAGSGSATANAITRRSVSGTATADAVIQRAVSGSVPADAVVKWTAAGSTSADAIVRRTAAASMAADALIQSGTLTASVQLDAVLRVSRSATLTGNAIIRVTASGSARAEAVIGRTAAASLAASAIVQAPRTVGVTSDAVLSSLRSGTFTAAASIAGGGAQVFSAAAVIIGPRAGSLTAAAITLASRSADLTLDASLVVRRQAELIAEAVVRRERTTFLTTSAVLQQTSSSSITLGALVRATASASISADAVIVGLGYPFTADAIIKALDRTRSVTVDAVIGLTPSVIRFEATLSAAAFEATLSAACFEAQFDPHLHSFSVDAVIVG